MSFKPIVVALHRDPDMGLERQLDLVMRPFVRGRDRDDPDEGPGRKRCDGWCVGGRWSGRFLSSAVHFADVRSDLVDPMPFPDDSPLSGRLACDGGPKRLLDLEHARAAAEVEAWREWPAFLERRRSPFTGRFREPETAATVRAEFDRYVAAVRGRAIADSALVTLEGEWIETNGPGLGDRYAEADGYIDALDGGVWLVCLCVHH
ncbi:hypothetical protein O4J56_14735 [Nocardiopsis sp. RSe5-2]|uniref:Uncharacterized protein n=1 Tax=Nocardiopsis endophytica TaxID=3018445 RepID=A0ABT4U4N0_9ACTN|nr:hypothetical protein [Nocardiopsis endophytica]MDA2811897.1 hypothetical protein [Nocardiopsis endophytica]